MWIHYRISSAASGGLLAITIGVAVTLPAWRWMSPARYGGHGDPDKRKQQSNRDVIVSLFRVHGCKNLKHFDRLMGFDIKNRTTSGDGVTNGLPTMVVSKMGHGLSNAPSTAAAKPSACEVATAAFP